MYIDKIKKTATDGRRVNWSQKSNNILAEHKGLNSSLL
jgi:hypothetical protein